MLEACSVLFRRAIVNRGVVAGAIGITAVGCIREEIAQNDFPDADFDEDGVSALLDCDDAEPLVYPEANYADDPATQNLLEEMACQRERGIDADCDGEPDYFCVIVNPPPPDLDEDMDGYAVGDDCDDEEALIYPEADHSDDPTAMSALERLACQRGEAIDADCDGVSEFQCVITNMAD